MEQAGHWVAPSAKAITFIEQLKTEEMPPGCLGSKASVAVGRNKENNEEKQIQS
jgi:hypothetical protein